MRQKEDRYNRRALYHPSVVRLFCLDHFALFFFKYSYTNYCIFARITRTKNSKKLAVKLGCGLYANFTWRCGFTARWLHHTSRQSSPPFSFAIS